MTDTFFTRSGSSPGGTRNLNSLEILVDSILCNAGCILVSVLQNQRPVLVLFRANNEPDLHVMRAVDLSHRDVLRKVDGAEVCRG